MVKRFIYNYNDNSKLDTIMIMSLDSDADGDSNEQHYWIFSKDILMCIDFRYLQH